MIIILGNEANKDLLKNRIKSILQKMTKSDLGQLTAAKPYYIRKKGLKLQAYCLIPIT